MHMGRLSKFTELHGTLGRSGSAIESISGLELLAEASDLDLSAFVFGTVLSTASGGSTIDF